jgi:WD40 repeat protein
VFSPVRGLLACGGCGDGELSTDFVQLWDLETKETRRLACHGRQVWSLAWSPNGKILAAGDWECGVRIHDVSRWDSVGSSEPRVLVDSRFIAASLCYSPNGRFLAAAGGDWDRGQINVWDTHGWTLLRTLEHDQLVYSVAFSSDGTTLAAGDWSGGVKLWEIPSGGPRVALAGHATAVSAVALSPDGKTLASGGMASYVRLWRVATGELLASLPTQVEVSSLVFSKDGKSLIAGRMDRSVSIYRASAADETIYLD